MKKERVMAVATVLLLLTGVAANYHFVYGSSISGVKVFKKLSLSLSETLINIDAVGNMPMIAARMNYPMFTERMRREARMTSEPVKKIETPCSKIYPGLLQSDVMHACGATTNTGIQSDGSQSLHWAEGISAVVKDGVVTQVHK